MAEAREGFVLDCSVTMAWCFGDERSLYTEGVHDQLAAMAAVVPAIWRLEVANATLVGERKKRLDQARGTQFLAFLELLPIAVDDESDRRVFSDVVHLARAHGLSSYDAAYLELAVRRGLPMACLDGKLKKAASAVGVSLFIP